MLHDFWIDFIGAVNDIKEVRITQVLDALNDLLEPHIFPARADGGDRAPVPAMRHRQAVAQGRTLRRLHRLLELSGMQLHPADDAGRRRRASGTKVLGEDPATGLEVTLRGGRFGTYLQLGEQIKRRSRRRARRSSEAEKPKRASLPKGVAPDDIDLDKALALLALPREVGKHPEDGEPIIAGVGRFGPYVKHGKTYANLEDGDDVLTVGLNRAVTLIAEKNANPEQGPPLRRRSGQGARRASRQGRPDRGQERPLRPLCQPQRRQRHAHRRQDARHHDARRGDRAARRARRSSGGKSPKPRRAAGRKGSRRGKAAANPGSSRSRSARTAKAKAAAAKPKKPRGHGQGRSQRADQGRRIAGWRSLPASDHYISI